MKDDNKEYQHVERIIENLNQHWHSIQLLLSHVSQPLLVDDRGLKQVLNDLNTAFQSCERTKKRNNCV